MVHVFPSRVYVVGSVSCNDTKSSFTHPKRSCCCNNNFFRSFAVKITSDLPIYLIKSSNCTTSLGLVLVVSIKRLDFAYYVCSTSVLLKKAPQIPWLLRLSLSPVHLLWTPKIFFKCWVRVVLRRKSQSGLSQLNASSNVNDFSVLRFALFVIGHDTINIPEIFQSPHVRWSGFRNPRNVFLCNPESWALESGIQY